MKEIIKAKIGKFTKAEIVSLCPTLSETTIERCLKELLDQNKIEKHGEKRQLLYEKGLERKI